MHIPARSFYWHSLSHYIGLDVHDTHLLGHERKLAPGYAITVEPGLYIPDEERYGQYRGIGVRIEDDILVTQVRYAHLNKFRVPARLSYRMPTRQPIGRLTCCAANRGCLIPPHL